MPSSTSTSAISQLRADAEFLQQTTLQNTALPRDASNDALATLQATNKFHLEIQDLLQHRRLYPWRSGKSSIRTTSDDEIAMVQWWKLVQDYVQTHITDVLERMPLADGDGIRVLPFLSKEYPPLSMISYSSIIPTVSLTVILPMSSLCTQKNDYKHERYFEKRQEVIHQIAIYLQNQGGRNQSYQVQSQVMDVRKTALLVIPTASAPRKVTRCSFHIRLQFQMDSMDWIPSTLRLLPHRCNNSRGTHIPPDPSNQRNHPANISSVQYNYSLTEDAVHITRPSDRTYIDLLANIQIRHGIALITIWCMHRGLYILDQGFHDDVIFILVQYLIYTKRIPYSRNIQPISVLTSFLTLLSETQWLLPTSTPHRDTTDPENLTKRSSFRCPRRTILIMPEYIGQSGTVTISQSEIAQRYETMIQEELSHRKKNHHGTNDPIMANDLPITLLDLYETTNVITTPVLLNPTLQHNFLFRISSSMIHRAKQYARRSLCCVHPTGSNAVTPLFTLSHTNPFQHLFGSNNDIAMNTTTESDPATTMSADQLSFYTQCDAYLRIPLTDIDPNKRNHMVSAIPSLLLQSLMTDSNSWLYHWTNDIVDVGYDEALVRGLLRTLRRALQDRIVDIQALLMDPNSDTNVGSLKTDQPQLSKITLPKYIVLGFVINPDTCYRVVDRCLSSASGFDDTSNTNQSVGVQEFLSLWGPKAELRRFKDGAIVHAVVWDETSTASNNDNRTNGTSSLYIQYQNDDTWQGGVVERIVRHILKFHFLKNDVTDVPQFLIRDIVSMVDGVANRKSVLDFSTKSLPLPSSPLLTNPMLAHRSIMKSFESLSDWLRKNSMPTIPVPGSATAMKSALGIPLSIDRVEPLSPALRYAALYPPLPHPLLASASPAVEAASSLLSGQKKCSGAIQSDPIDIQICFGSSSKWPHDLKAIGAAKTAMLIEIVNGIENLKKDRIGDSICQCFDERFMMVTPSYAIICFMGYVFRMTLKADREIQILQDLNNPSVEASQLLKFFAKQSIIVAKHHSMVHGVYTSHPSSSATVRLIKRWLSSHLLASDEDVCIPFEVIELTVAHVYTSQSRLLGAPTTVFSGFMEWLRFVSSYNWVKRPLIVDPQGHLNDADHYSILEQFEFDRGELFQNGPAWYIVAPYDRCISGRVVDDDIDVEGSVFASKSRPKSAQRLWMPTFSAVCPERVVSFRIAALATRTYSYLRHALLKPNDIKNVAKWPGAFQETHDAFRSFSALLRIDPSFIVNIDASSNAPLGSLLVQQIPLKKNEDVFMYESSFTRSMCSLANGPKDLRKKLYRNLMMADDENHHESKGKLLTEWNPIRLMVQLLRSKLGQLALIFYNDLCPEVLGIVWRQPIFFQSRSFSAVTSEYARPVTKEHWQSDTMVSYNVHDVLRTISLYSRYLASDLKVFDYGYSTSTPSLPSPKVKSVVKAQNKRKRKQKAMVSSDAEDSHNDDDDDSTTDS